MQLKNSRQTVCLGLMPKRYAPRGQYLWDPWFIREGDRFHLFHLQAPKSYGLSDRHHHTSIGHAVSDDLVRWKQLPTALEPGGESEWDGLALWTGSVIKKDDTYYMFYTGRRRREFWVQRIGLATSNDLVHWRKHPANPILEADRRYYRMTNALNRLSNPPAWRDPFLFKDEESGSYYMIITARTRGKQRVYNGCLAAARSDDLLTWEVLPPIFAPGVYDEIETPSLVRFHGDYYLFFSTCSKNYKPTFEHVYGAHEGLHCYYASELFGEYRPINGFGVVFSNGKRMYDIQLIRHDDRFWGLGSLYLDRKGEFLGRLSLPFEIVLDGKVIYTTMGMEKSSVAARA